LSLKWLVGITRSSTVSQAGDFGRTASQTASLFDLQPLRSFPTPSDVGRDSQLSGRSGAGEQQPDSRSGQRSRLTAKLACSLLATGREPGYIGRRLPARLSAIYIRGSAYRRGRNKRNSTGTNGAFCPHSGTKGPAPRRPRLACAGAKQHDRRFAGKSKAKRNRLRIPPRDRPMNLNLTEDNVIPALWAKSAPLHPLWKHLLDAAAVPLALPNPLAGDGWSSNQTAPLVGLHDVGKADACFQHQVPGFSAELVHRGFPTPSDARCRHERLSARYIGKKLEHAGLDPFAPCGAGRGCERCESAAADVVRCGGGGIP